jgi:hypothetical protein
MGSLSKHTGVKTPLVTHVLSYLVVCVAVLWSAFSDTFAEAYLAESYFTECYFSKSYLVESYLANSLRFESHNESVILN